MADATITLRGLNRATLARQFLLERADVAVHDALEHLVGLQAQVPLNPYTALWSRLRNFEPDDLGRMMLDHRVVRSVVMRGTIHMLTAQDCLTLRPLMQPVLDMELQRHPEFKGPLAVTDMAPILARVRALMNEAPRTQRQLRSFITEQFPDVDAAAAAYACRNRLTLVQVPPRGVWGQRGQVCSTTVEAWLGRSVDDHPSLDATVLRYLAAFGPATVADVAAWSRLTGQREVIERLRPRLIVLHDDRGRELFDLPDAPRPDPGAAAPVRFLPEYDNVLLSHADRSRFWDPALQAAELELTAAGTMPPAAERQVHGTVLVDGLVRATWRTERDQDRSSDGGAFTTLVVDHIGAMATRVQDRVSAEGRRMLRFAAAGDEHAVTLHRLDRS